MVAAGLCSVTLRALTAQEVVDRAAAAGLAAIEWGGDVHVPPGDPATAREVRARTVDAGLTCCSYGSYFRAGPHDVADFGPVLTSALALGVPRIRIWAGTLGSAEAGPDDREAVVRATRAAAAMAADHGVELAFEWHGGTLTDDLASARRLLDEVGADNVSTYWQPPVGMPDDDAVAQLRAVLPAVSAVHVFSWWPERERHPLTERLPLWRAVAEVLRGSERVRDALLEFVVNDDPERLAADASTLRELIC